MNHSNKSTMAAVLCIQIRITKSVVKAPQQDLLWTWWHWGFCVGPPLGPLHPLPEPPNQDVKHESHVSSSRSRNVYYNYSYPIKLNYGDSENAILHRGDVLLPTGWTHASMVLQMMFCNTALWRPASVWSRYLNMVSSNSGCGVTIIVVLSS